MFEFKKISEMAPKVWYIFQLWTSDAYFTNEKEASLHVHTVPNIMLLVEPDGTIFYSQRSVNVYSGHFSDNSVRKSGEREIVNS